MKNKVRFYLHNLFAAFVGIAFAANLCIFLLCGSSVSAIQINEFNRDTFSENVMEYFFVPNEGGEGVNTFAVPATKGIPLIKHETLDAQNKKSLDIIVCDDYYWPLHGPIKIDSAFGWRIDPIYQVLHFHKGVDLDAEIGTPIHAAADGVVEIAKFSTSAGYYVSIKHENDVVTQYLHCSELLVSVGEEVKADQVIALVGNTGLSTGPHLDFRFYINGEAVDPVKKYKLNFETTILINHRDDFMAILQGSTKRIAPVVSLDDIDSGTLSE